MKKIPLWKMIVLSIVTLFYYEIYWLITQKPYLIKKTGAQLPSSWWLIGAAAATIPVYIGIIVSFFIPTPSLTLILISVAIASILILIASGIRIWWILLFINASEKVLKPRVTTTWLTLHLFTVGFDVIFIEQYYFNKKVDPQQKKPSQRFVSLSIASIVSIYVIAIILGAIIGIFSLQYDEGLQNITQNAELNALAEKSDALNREYGECIKQLDADFPEVTEESEQYYQIGYNACDDIRIEQNEAANNYRLLSERLLKN